MESANNRKPETNPTMEDFVNGKAAADEAGAQGAKAAGNVENAGESEEVFLDEEGAPRGPQPVGNPEAEQKYLRLMADFDNFRRRSAREKSEERQRGRRDAAEKLLPVYDSLSMGLISMPKDSPARSGLEAIQRQLQTAFDQLGISRVETKGQPFDPQIHEAIGHLPSNLAEGTVCEESRAGFRDDLGLLRPAQVLVSSGPQQ